VVFLTEQIVTFELQPKAESYTQDALAKIDINIGPVGYAYRGILEEIKSVKERSKNFTALYVEGLYGSGKTLLLRKIVYDIISGQYKEEMKNVFPIYFFLGEMDFKLLDGIKMYIEDLKTYISTDELPVKPNIIGEKSDWKNREQMIEGCLKIINDVEGRYKDKKLEEKQLRGFFDVLRELNKQGIIPLIIFDEFERVVYSGEGLKSELGRSTFAAFASMYLELTRGHIYSGAFIIATTNSIRELVEKAIAEEKPLRHIFNALGIGLGKPDEFPMVRSHIVYDGEFKLDWDTFHLDILAKRYKLIIHERLLELISKVLPTPRAIIQIDRKTRIYYPKEKEVLSLDKFYKIIEKRINMFIEALKKEKIGKGYIITSKSLWHERFVKLIEKGYFIIKSDDYLSVAKSLEIEAKNDREARRKVSQILNNLSQIGLFEKLGAGEFRLNPHILAYALEIENLPDGSKATIDELLNKVRTAMENRRKKPNTKKESIEARS
jgi:hypothetical protein